MKTIGIVAHSAEGGSLCFLTACREGQRMLGDHFHPEIVLSAIPMGNSMPAWESDDYDSVAVELRRGVEQVARAGADFFVCPDNTAHIVLEQIIDTLPIPGIHIADAVCNEMNKKGWRNAGLLGTRWTMTGTVYPVALRKHDMKTLTPDPTRQASINDAIFDELCLGNFNQPTTDMFAATIEELAGAGADCVILGCTEIPLIISDSNSALPVLDSTRLLATCAVETAIHADPLSAARGWLGCGSGQ